MLQPNTIKVDDGVSACEEIVQTTGFGQGDNISPLLFTILVSDLSHRISSKHKFVGVLQYADDLVLSSRSQFYVQQSLATLNEYVKEVGLTINSQKTEAMKFRKEGRLAATDELRLAGVPVKFMNTFCYLGVTLTVTGKSFTPHIVERLRRALIAATPIASPQKLSVGTALGLFTLKVAPSAAYGVEVIWGYLDVRALIELDRIKPVFLKRVLGLHNSTRNRLIYALVGSPSFTEELQARFQLENGSVLEVR